MSYDYLLRLGNMIISIVTKVISIPHDEFLIPCFFEKNAHSGQWIVQYPATSITFTAK